MRVKMVADTTDPYTMKMLEKLWNKLNEKQRLYILNRMGHSEKWVDSEFNDLTGDIQSKLLSTTMDLVTVNGVVTAQNVLNTVL
jgi:hypothetical protein